MLFPELVRQQVEYILFDRIRIDASDISMLDTAQKLAGLNVVSNLVQISVYQRSLSSLFLNPFDRLRSVQIEMGSRKLVTGDSRAGIRQVNRGTILDGALHAGIHIQRVALHCGSVGAVVRLCFRAGPTGTAVRQAAKWSDG